MESDDAGRVGVSVESLLYNIVQVANCNLHYINFF